MKKKLLFVFNPKSGKGLIKEHLVNIVDIMTKEDTKSPFILHSVREMP